MADETDAKDIATLKELAEKCVGHLILISRQEEIESDIVENYSYWATRQSAEFNVWCTNIGMNGKGLRSIDLRLKDVPEICDLLKHLLNSLKHDLKELQHPSEEPATSNNDAENPADDESDDSSLYPSLSSSSESERQLEIGNPMSIWEKKRMALQRHVSDTIDRLHSHARQIDHAGLRRRRERVELYREKEGAKEVYEGFKRLASWRANKDFESASSTIKLKIAESVARRRIRFEYFREHQKERTLSSDYQMANLPQQDPVSPPPGQIVTISGRQEMHQSTKSEDSVAQGAMDSSSVDEILDMKFETKQRERVESVASVALRHPRFPPPPKVHCGKFTCPYCFLEFPACEASENCWIQHLMHDFEPYFCVVDGCEAPFDVPTTFDGFMGHLQDHHPIRYHVTISDVDQIEFDEAEFEAYVKRHDEASEEDLSILKKASQRRGVFLFTSCPFCGGYPDILKKPFPDPVAEQAQTELRQHIKHHMQDVALLLPLYRDDISENEDLESCVTSGRRSELRISENSGNWRTICERSSCDCKQSGGDSGIDESSDADIQQSAADGNEDIDFWPDILVNSSLYDRSAVTDDYYQKNEQLKKFMENSDDLGRIGQSGSHMEIPVLPPAVIPSPVSKKDNPSIKPADLLGMNIFDASRSGDYIKVDKFLKEGIDVDVIDDKGSTPLFYAASNCHATVARLLIKHGADVDIPCQDSISPLWESVYSVFKSSKGGYLARFFLEESLRQDYGTPNQHASLIRAVCDGDLKEMNSLLQQGADPDLRDRWNVTPLFWAAFYGHGGLVKLLIDHDVDVNAANSDNRTPLIQAAIRGFPDVVQLLIQTGANPQLRDRWGKSALYWASSLGHNHVYKLLQSPSRVPDSLDATKGEPRRLEKTWEITKKPKEAETQVLEDDMKQFITAKKLHKFFPDGNSFLKQVVQRALDLEKSHPSNSLSPRYLSALAFYQLIIYCDDSGSTRMENQKKHLSRFVQQIASISTRVKPDNEGIELRFINAATTPAMSNPTLNKIDQVIQQNPFNGKTEIGRNLRKKVLEDGVYRCLEENKFQRPVIVSIIIDGEPCDEGENTLKNVIMQCGRRLAARGYRKTAVRFQITQIGSDPDAEKFLNYMRNDSKLKDLNILNIRDGEREQGTFQQLERSTDRILDKIDSKLKKFRDNDGELEKWV
ncbi:hypothetical protein N7540_002096 [Penicillium herquei]|nr:hypothetical protein N7540_002096 [Penicillium herquei]